MITGRWLSIDPIEDRGGENLYTFSLNSPNLWIDPVGLQAQLNCKIYLTFDDGPRGGTDDVLDVLDAVGIQGKATFFIVGVHIEDWAMQFSSPWRGKRRWTGAEIVQLIARLGNLVGTHSYSHPLKGKDLEKWYSDPEGVTENFRRNAEVLGRLLGVNYPGLWIRRLPGRNVWRYWDWERAQEREQGRWVEIPYRGEEAVPGALLGEIYGWDEEYKRGKHSQGDQDKLL
jgi:peptidoglycan/xylan/chitin deacetylase (PgdA/CDA1 family)